MRFLQLLKRVLALRDDPVPAVCFPACNNAYIEAQKVGKSQSICATNSTFTKYKLTCDKCFEENAYHSHTSNATYFNSRLLEIVGFCNLTKSEPTVEEFSSLLKVASIENASMSKAYEQERNRANATMTVTQTFTPTNSMLTPTSTSNMDLNPNPNPNSIPKPSQAWIAGAVIGPFVLLATIVTFAIFMRRRRNKEKAGVLMEVDMDAEKKVGDPKPELHSESKKVVIYEMQSGYEEPEPVELPAREPIGTELAPSVKVKELVRKPVTKT